MTKNLTYLSFFVLIGLLFFFQRKEQPTTIVPPSNRLETKHEPSEQFFLQRAYPDGKFNIKAYKKALSTAKNQVAQRTGSTGINTHWEVQGPGNIGARINTVAVHPTDDAIIYAGFSGGGVWKTTDNGANWTSIFDDQLFLAIGDITIDPNDPNTIYVGTGDENISGYPFIGDGLYKSTDAGATWTHLGLEEQRIISEIIIDPTDSDIIYVGTMGLPFEPTPQRGLYKTIDGGATWEQILFVSEGSGVIDLVMQPDNPQVLYAAVWDRLRSNTISFVFGENAKIHKTTDGGATWTILKGGLPDEKMGRIGLAISEQNPETVFATYADTTSQLHRIYKTENGGILWNTLNTSFDSGLSDNALGGFAWYFGKLRVNPKNDNDIFLLGVDLWRSVDGGQSWLRATPPWWQNSVHADKHDLVFTNVDNVVLATDGGLYKKNILTETWMDIENIPATQFYRVAYNPHQPDWYYGGAQDNGTTGGNNENITDWPRILGGDGFQTVFNPDNPNIMYAETQRGRIEYSEDMGNSWEYGTFGIDGEDNRNWDMPYMMSPHNSNVLFAGTDRIYRTEQEEGAPFWKAISMNLTDQDTSNSRYHNITTLDESPLLQDLLYAGTGDGNIWRKDNDGTSWDKISENLPNQYVTSVHASPNEAETVYAAHSGYRDNDNAARIYRSYDRGDNWEAIDGDLPDVAINDIWVYPNYQDSVLFVATDGGVYLTQDAGTSWNRLGSEMPFITVYDIAWNEAHNEIIAGTFARSIMTFPLDSLGIMADETMVSSESVVQSKPNFEVQVFPNPASAFLHVKFTNSEPNKAAEIVILDAQGRLILKKETAQQGKVTEQIDIQHLSAGTYFVKVKVRHGVRSAIFVKK